MAQPSLVPSLVAGLVRPRPPSGPRGGSLRAIVLVRAPEAVRQGLQQLAAYRMRTAIALLGIVVGVMAVVGSRALLVGVEQMVRASFERFIGGDRAGLVRGVRTMYKAGRQITFEKVYFVTPEDRAVFASLPEVEAVTTSISAGESVARGHQRLAGVDVRGVGANFRDIRGFRLLAGRFLTPDDEARRARVTVISKGLVTSLFGRADALGEEILVEGQRFTVVGIAGSLGNLNPANWKIAYVPFETAILRLGKNRGDAATWVKVRRGSSFAALEPTLIDILERRHPGARKENFRTFSGGRWQGRILEDISTQGGILSAVAILCLVAGGVGIMNVFLISVTERTREIGLRIALGATRRGVLVQFLFEATLLCMLGGIAGVALGQGLAVGLAEVVRGRFKDSIIDPTILSVALDPGTVALGLGLAFATAVVFGSYPAWRASRLDPATSLRAE